MKKIICTATIKYTRHEVQLHVNALKMALNIPSLANYRGRYESLLKDMKRIAGDATPMTQQESKENDALINRDDSPQNVEGDVRRDA